MKIRAITFLLIALTFKVLGCSSDDETIKVTVDIVDGFAGQTVLIAVNGSNEYSEDIPGSVPLAGPADRFTTRMNTGVNTLTVRWRETGSQLSYEMETVEIIIGDAEEYYLILNIGSGGLFYELREEPLLYA